MAEAKKAQSAAQVNPVVKYFRETRGELRKVTWPTREDALRLTRIVILTSLGFAVFLGALDFVFSQVVNFLVGLVAG